MPVLVKASALQVYDSWRLNHQEWGKDLPLETYLAREQAQVDTYRPTPPDTFSPPVPQSKSITSHGSQINWILVPELGSSDILAACETLPRPAILSLPSSRPRSSATEDESARRVIQGTGYGIASVYCRPEYRGKGYASLMLTLLAKELDPRRQSVSDTNDTREAKGDANGSGGGWLGGGLWSDIGTKYYTQFGWPSFTSRQVSISLPQSTSSSPLNRMNLDSEEKGGVGSWIIRENLSEVSDLDVSMIVEEETKGQEDMVADVEHEVGFWSFLPTCEVFNWHHARMDFMYSHLHPSSPPITTLGFFIPPPPPPPSTSEASHADASDASPALVIWTLQFSETESERVMYLLRLRYRTHSQLRILLSRAVRVAKSYGMSKVVVWSHAKETLMDSLPSAEIDQVEEEVTRKNSISALHVNQIVGFDGEVKWLNNEKFCWC